MNNTQEFTRYLELNKEINNFEDLLESFPGNEREVNVLNENINRSIQGMRDSLHFGNLGKKYEILLDYVEQRARLIKERYLDKVMSG